MAKKGEIKKTAEQFEAEFEGLTLPESFYVAPGAFVPNTREFLEKALYILKNGRERVAEPVRWRLEVLLALIRSEKQQYGWFIPHTSQSLHQSSELGQGATGQMWSI